MRSSCAVRGAAAQFWYVLRNPRGAARGGIHCESRAKKSRALGPARLQRIIELLRERLPGYQRRLWVDYLDVDGEVRIINQGLSYLGVGALI